MLRLIACACLLLMAGCAPPPPPPAIVTTIPDKDPPCDREKIRSIARKYIPTITSPSAHHLEAEMAYKAMKASFINMTMMMYPYPKQMCWNAIEYELDIARIAAAKDRGEFNGR